MINKVADLSINLQTPPQNYYCAAPATGIFADTIHLIGFGFDGTACFRKGTKDGPDALRAVSDGIESFSPYLNADVDDIQFTDLGNLIIPGEINYDDTAHTQAQWQAATDDFFSQFAGLNLKQDNIKIVTLGGEHSISYAPVTTYLKQYDDLVLIHLDAHADLRDGYEGYHYSHASIIRRCLDHFKEGHRLIQYGIRSGTKDEYQYMQAEQTLIRSRQQFLDEVAALDDQRPIYLTFDLDYFDPSFFPGTGTPEPGGEDFHSFVSLCKILRDKNFVGCDVVELSPSIDSTGNSDVFAAKVVRELLLCLAGK
ncbi:agmatinase [Thalassotalea ponticola]|uniref:agmatinase n=1 Tax=Thalassotalea ponticola TaxID=1523392 RepID=UPI0025B523EA|nr:agmatinase [Thalassotalea ponticola]MDN3652073.1 agmatinase [Thalassotalea ponticola]